MSSQSMNDDPTRLAGNRDAAQLAAPHLPFAAFSASGQLRMPPGLRAAPGTWSSEMELLFMVMPLACRQPRRSSVLHRPTVSPGYCSSH